MKRSFIIVSMDKNSYDYDTLAEYFYHSENILRLSYTTDGFFIDFCYEADAERRKFIERLMRLDVDDIEIHDILYEEFLKGA